MSGNLSRDYKSKYLVVDKLVEEKAKFQNLKNSKNCSLVVCRLVTHAQRGKYFYHILCSLYFKPRAERLEENFNCIIYY
jgi:hypothetical protein